jgi:hypothetical protein
VVSRAEAVGVKEAHPSREKGSLFGLLAATGLRIGQALALNRDEADLKVESADHQSGPSPATSVWCRYTPRQLPH